MALTNAPTWWVWDVRITQHAELRMEQRGLTEVELREMLERASSLAADVVEGRFVAASVHLGRTWEVIVEPDDLEQVLDVITVYPLGRRP
jgi:hypothetical protein